MLLATGADGYRGRGGGRRVAGGDEFELDPYEPLGALPHPFAFFGFLPTLFDAPSRDPVIDMDWLAHSFLCRLTEADANRQITALAGFAWGFSARGGRITPTGPEALAREAWDSHRQLLASEYPEWSFQAQRTLGAIKPS